MDPSNLPATCRRYTADIGENFHPRTVTLKKDKSGFGFTLRHFIVYPPTSFSCGKTKQENNEDSSLSLAQWKSDYKSKPMDTIFIREVKEGSPAHNAGLTKGDRIIAINNYPLTGKSYSDIIHLILRSGRYLRLLVVPKEDDILQLYFASSAYQPVHREQKQHKYLVPSFHPKSEQSNQLYRQSSYGTYPGRVHNKIKVSNEKVTENRKQISKQVYLDSNLSCDSNQEFNLSHPLHSVHDLEKKEYDHSLVDEHIFQSGCFSEDEGHYNHSKELPSSSLSESQPSNLKDTVSNFYYNLCHNQPPSVISLSSEENLNYPIYMSDIDDIVHCDNMEESRTVSDARCGLNLPKPVKYPYQSERPQYIVGNTCDQIGDSSCFYMSDSQTPSPWIRSRMGKIEESGFTTDTDINYSSLIHNRSDEFSSLPPDFSYGENKDTLSINLVAQRRHQFESGNLLAESMERMNLYRSELSRMSKPNQVRIVSTRAAEFENKSQTSVISPTRNHKTGIIDKKDDNLGLHFIESNPATSTSCDFDSLDHQNRNEAEVGDSSQTNDVDSSQSYNSAVISEFASGVPGVVHRRKTVPVSSDQDECHIVRRISYLRATANERMNVESDLSEEEEVSDASSPNKEYRIQKLKSFFGEKTPKVKQALHPIDLEDPESSYSPDAQEPKSVYGWVICKVVSLEGKRSSDRSWRHLWAILRNNILYLLKERREPSKGTLTGDEHVINVKYSIAKVANDYVKRKHVLRLMLLNGTEYLVQTESHTSMMEWLKALQIFAREIAALPEWLKNTSVLEKAAAYEQQIQTNKGKPVGQHHPVKKLVFRHKGPSEHSPTVKTRRASQGDELALTKIGVLWRERMVQGWKKVHGTNSQVPKFASFGVKLENAPPGVTNEHIPLIVELCVQIVENRGLDVVGIYRVPGNNASVSVLTDMVNQGIDDVVVQDSRWNDVNIVSSLLKAFFRKLPEPLLTSYLYPKFIQASKIDDPVKRLKAIKHVIFHLPVHYFATLRYLMYHLKKVVEHSPTNKMEARNLAIVFGPTLVRTTDNNMVTMVTDMSHQCYLIETMIVHAEWLFEDCDVLPLEVTLQDKRKTHPPSNIQSNALLSNINKLDDNALDSLPHEMFASFYNTATRHLRHRQKKKDASNAKKRSGIIADDTDILSNQNENDIMTPTKNVSEKFDSSAVEIEHLSDISFGSCSSLISGSSKTKQRSLSKEQQPRNGSLPCATAASSEMDNSRMSGIEDDVVHHRYNELSALAQEKIKNFEQETKALLRRDFQRPRASVGTHVEWEQIEREWQKAKLELEQEDLLDYLADDPSYLSCLLHRGEGVLDLSPPNNSNLDERAYGKNEFPESSSSFSVKEFHQPDVGGKISTFDLPPSCLQNEKSVLKYDKNSIASGHSMESFRTKFDKSEIIHSISTTPINERIVNTPTSEDSLNLISSKSSNNPDNNYAKSKDEHGRLLMDPGSDNVTFPCDSNSTHPSSLS